MTKVDPVIIASESSWIEGEAIRQLETTAQLPGMERAAGLPDLHPGKGIPIGAAFLSKGIIYPHLVGNDIGCGMGLWQTDIEAAKFKLDKSVKKLTGFESIWDGDAGAAQRLLLAPCQWRTFDHQRVQHANGPHLVRAGRAHLA